MNCTEVSWNCKGSDTEERRFLISAEDVDNTILRARVRNAETEGQREIVQELMVFNAEFSVHFC